MAQLQLVEPGELALSSASAVEGLLEHGEIFTRRWIVDLILDLAGYTPSRDLTALTAVEPACGGGAFIVPMVDRLVESWIRHGRIQGSLDDAIRGYDVLTRNVESTKGKVRDRLVEHGLTAVEAARLADRWIRWADYLLDAAAADSADLVVGNPPYIRLESVPDGRHRAYRAACSTMAGRADIYIGFYEQALRSLRPDGVVAFICADRWMRNAYGARLRELISSSYSVDLVVEAHELDAFEDAVSAYPAITVLRRGPQGPAIISKVSSDFDQRNARAFVQWARSGEDPHLVTPGVTASRLPHWFSGYQSWPAGTPDEIELIARLEEQFPPLEDPRTGTKIGIGVATGADEVFVTTDAEAVETGRLLPLTLSRDVRTGNVRWSGHYLINPWYQNGLVELDDFPRLAHYLHRHRIALRGRHVAKGQTKTWYRTIDRVNLQLANQPKLLFADMGKQISPVLDDVGYYPHHNLYWITSDKWDLRVLGGLLLSDVANLFISMYSVKMRGGTLRFQSQYLRRIRVPELASIAKADATGLARAFDRRDRVAATAIARRLYGLA